MDECVLTAEQIEELQRSVREVAAKRTKDAQQKAVKLGNELRRQYPGLRE